MSITGRGAVAVLWCSVALALHLHIHILVDGAPRSTWNLESSHSGSNGRCDSGDELGRSMDD